MVNRKNYLCGEAADAASPCRNHYKWHIYWRTKPCPKSVYQRRWWEAEERAGGPLPDGPPPRHNHVCGEAADAASPNEAHYIWHLSPAQRTEPCPKSVEERAWRRAELRAGKPLPDWERPPQPPPSVCGGEDAAARPTDGHYRRHLRRGQTPCPAAVMERRWLAAETRLGRSLNKEEAAAAIRPRRYTCGGEEDYREPSWGHYAYHRRRGEEPCPKSRREIREAERANNAAKRKKERQ